MLGLKAADIGNVFWRGRLADELTEKIPDALSSGSMLVPINHIVPAAPNAVRAPPIAMGKPGAASARMVTNPAGAALILDVVLNKKGVVSGSKTGLGLRENRAKVWSGKLAPLADYKETPAGTRAWVAAVAKAADATVLLPKPTTKSKTAKTGGYRKVHTKKASCAGKKRAVA